MNDWRNLLFLIEFVLLVMLNKLLIPKKLYLVGSFFQNSGESNTVTSLTVNSLMDIFLQVLQNFQNIAIFKSVFKNTFCQ